MIPSMPDKERIEQAVKAVSHERFGTTLLPSDNRHLAVLLNVARAYLQVLTRIEEESK